DSGFELTGFLDADYAGCKDTFKSISGGAQFLGEMLLGFRLGHMGRSGRGLGYCLGGGEVHRKGWVGVVCLDGKIRGINVDSCVCPICSTGQDEINHILFRCDLAQQHGGIHGGLGTASSLREFFPDVRSELAMLLCRLIYVFGNCNTRTFKKSKATSILVDFTDPSTVYDIVKQAPHLA
nr:hypothetical protein [Tanacetum cinerariifolium]